ncbi:MAG: diguanylate cyclase [Nitrospiraceae bacterium]|nr:MAG: diguanylate cyclase [Nitrospiraceae bacterium]
MTLSRFLLITVVAISLAAIIDLYYVSLLPPLSAPEKIIFSTSLVSLVLLPVLYYQMYRPLNSFADAAAKAEKRFHALSLTDDLTGLYSRRGFTAVADHEIEVAKRQKTKPVFIRTEISNLQNIEDTFGDRERNNALIAMANLLKTTHRKSDIIARLGDSEFVVYPVGMAGPDAAPEVITSRFQKNLSVHNAEAARHYDLAVQIGSMAIDTDRVHSVDTLFPETIQTGGSAE